MAKMLTLVIKHRTCPGWFSPNEPERAARWGRENDVSRGHMASSMCCIIRKSLRLDVCVWNGVAGGGGGRTGHTRASGG